MVQKIEVVTAIARRRRFTDTKKTAFVEETMDPGATVAEVARRHGLSASLLFTWRRALHAKALSAKIGPPMQAIAGDIVRQIEAELGACR